MNGYLFRSERLGFRQWKNEDIMPMAELCADPEVMEHFPSTMDRAEVEALVNGLTDRLTNDGLTFYAVDRLDTSEFIGFIGLINTSFESHFTPCVEIGWRLKRSAWNKGYASEGARACLQHGFETLRLSKIYSPRWQTLDPSGSCKKSG